MGQACKGMAAAFQKRRVKQKHQLSALQYPILRTKETLNTFNRHQALDLFFHHYNWKALHMFWFSRLLLPMVFAGLVFKPSGFPRDLGFSNRIIYMYCKRIEPNLPQGWTNIDIYIYISWRAPKKYPTNRHEQRWATMNTHWIPLILNVYLGFVISFFFRNNISSWVFGFACV